MEGIPPPENPVGLSHTGTARTGIITAVWYEKQVFEQAEAEERSLLMQRAAASEAYRGLITLFLDNDRAMLWDDSDMEKNRTKRKQAKIESTVINT